MIWASCFLRRISFRCSQENAADAAFAKQTQHFYYYVLMAVCMGYIVPHSSMLGIYCTVYTHGVMMSGIIMMRSKQDDHDAACCILRNSSGGEEAHIFDGCARKCFGD